VDNITVETDQQLCEDPCTEDRGLESPLRYCTRVTADDNESLIGLIHRCFFKIGSNEI
jgi:hypothetical protein